MMDDEKKSEMKKEMEMLLHLEKVERKLLQQLPSSCQSFPGSSVAEVCDSMRKDQVVVASLGKPSLAVTLKQGRNQR